MPSRPRTIRNFSDHLCAQAVRMHSAISAMPEHYGDIRRIGLTNQLLGVRDTLAYVHGGGVDPTIPSSDPGAAVLAEWWQFKHPEQWADEARRRRRVEQLYFAVHRLVVHANVDSIPKLARQVGLPLSTMYFVLANPARPRWQTLEAVVLTLNGDRDELWTMWRDAFKPRAKTPRHPLVRDA